MLNIATILTKQKWDNLCINTLDELIDYVNDLKGPNGTLPNIIPSKITIDLDDFKNTLDLSPNPEAEAQRAEQYCSLYRWLKYFALEGAEVIIIYKLKTKTRSLTWPKVGKPRVYAKIGEPDESEQDYIHSSMNKYNPQIIELFKAEETAKTPEAKEELKKKVYDLNGKIFKEVKALNTQYEAQDELETELGVTSKMTTHRFSMFLNCCFKYGGDSSLIHRIAYNELEVRKEKKKWIVRFELQTNKNPLELKPITINEEYARKLCRAYGVEIPQYYVSLKSFNSYINNRFVIKTTLSDGKYYKSSSDYDGFDDNYLNSKRSKRFGRIVPREYDKALEVAMSQVSWLVEHDKLGFLQPNWAYCPICDHVYHILEGCGEHVAPVPIEFINRSIFYDDAIEDQKLEAITASKLFNKTIKNKKFKKIFGGKNNEK